jgi:hypothetical protein
MGRSSRLASLPLFTISTLGGASQRFQIEAQPANSDGSFHYRRIVEFSFDREDLALGWFTRVRRAYPR